MKSGKQIKINDNKNYSIIYGCVDNKKPKSIYINISAWAEPLLDYESDYNKIIKNINKKVKQTIYNFLSKNYTDVPFLKDKTIVDLDLRESGIKFGKRSFMCCEITLFQNEEVSINAEPVKRALNLVSTMVVEEIFDKDLNFKFNKKKQ